MGRSRSQGARLARAAGSGFVFGALAYGVPLSLLHLRHNDVGAFGASLATGLWMAVIYGLWAAATAVVAYVVVATWKAIRKSEIPDDGPLEPSLLLGLVGFNLVFWELAVLYGLTYDQVPFGRPEGATGMIAYVALLVVMIGILVSLASWALFGLLASLHCRGGLRKWVLALAGLALVLHLGAPVLSEQFFGEPAATAAPEEGLGDGDRNEEAVTGLPGVERLDTGLKVVFVGLDGADWQVIRPMMEAGELPAFAALLAEGSSGELETLPDANSAVIWASLYSGHRPREHRILDFYLVTLPGTGRGLFPVHRTYFKELVDPLATVGLARRNFISRYALARVPIWEITAHAGLSTGVVDGYFYSFPAPKVEDPESFFIAYGAERFELRRQQSGSDRDKDLFVQPPELFRRLQPILGQDDFDWQAAVLLDLLAPFSDRRSQPEFVTLYSHEPDRIQHLEWKWWQPRYYLGVDPEEVEARGDRIPEQYRKFDAFLAKLQYRLEPDTVLVIASDHGHTPTLLHGDFFTQHRHGPPGILIVAGGPVKAREILAGAHVYDVFPTLLHLLGLPVPEDIPGRVLEEALDPAFAARFPIRRIPTYEGLWPNPWGGAGGLTNEQSEEELRELRALGYLK